MAGTGGNELSAADRYSGRVPGELSRGARLWRVSLTSVWLVYLIQPVSGLFGHHHDALYIGGGLAIIAAFCAIFVITIADRDQQNRRSAIWLGIAVRARRWPPASSTAARERPRCGSTCRPSPGC